MEETLDLLNMLAMKIGNLTIRWIRGHQGHVSNERADLMARRGHDDLGPTATHSSDVAKGILKSEIDSSTNRLWRIMWNMDPTCRQSKMWFSEGPRPGFAFNILRIPRPLCTRGTRLSLTQQS